MAKLTPTDAIAEISHVIATIEEDASLDFDKGVETLLASISATTTRVVPSQWMDSHYDSFVGMCLDIVSTLETSDMLTDDQYLLTLDSLVAMFTDTAEPATVISSLMDAETEKEERLRQQFNDRYSIGASNDEAVVFNDEAATSDDEAAASDNEVATTDAGTTMTNVTITGLDLIIAKTDAIIDKLEAACGNTVAAKDATVVAETATSHDELTPYRTLEMMFDVIHDSASIVPVTDFKQYVLAEIIRIAKTVTPAAWSRKDKPLFEHVIGFVSSLPPHELSLPAFNAVVCMYTDTAPALIASEIREDLIERYGKEHDARAAAIAVGTADIAVGTADIAAGTADEPTVICEDARSYFFRMAASHI